MRGIGGTLTYAIGEEHYMISAENTGDYSQGILLAIRDLDQQILGPTAQTQKSQILRDLQAWSKETGNRLCW